MDRITVKVADPESPSVTLWERHPAHPGGEIWLSGAGSFDVAATSAVMALLRSGRLIAQAAAPEPPPKAKADSTEKAATIEPAEPELATIEPAEPVVVAVEPVPVAEPAEGPGVVPAETPVEDVSVVTQVVGPDASASKVQKKPRGTS